MTREDSGSADAGRAHPQALDWQRLMESYAASAQVPWPGPLPTSAGDITKYQALYDRFLEQRPVGDYDPAHAVRFRSTVAVLGPYLADAKNIIELGGQSPVGEYAAALPGASYGGQPTELRGRLDLPSASVDCVLCLEVLARLKDTPESETTIESQQTFNYSGVMGLLAESYRVLEPGGLLLVTTSNAVSVDVIARILRGDHPHLFDPHVRELAPKQVKAFAERVGFVLEAFGTIFAWTTADETTRSQILDFIASMGFDPSHRGDDAVFVFRKPRALVASSAAESAAYWRGQHFLGRVPDYEDVLREGFEKFLRPGDVIVDIGVNYGRHLKRFVELAGPDGRVIGFEPVPAFIEQARLVCGPDVEIRQKALSDHTGVGEFLFMTSAVGESGFKERESAGDRGAVPISVEIATLDLELQDVQRLDYIKIDTEGHEITILNGGRGVISRLRPIISVEWGSPTYSLYGHSAMDLFKWAVEADYRISDLFGNLVASAEEWSMVSDQSYWDYFLVPGEKVETWKALWA